MSISIETIWNASLDDIKKILAPIMTPALQKELNELITSYDSTILGHRILLLKLYRNKNLLDATSKAIFNNPEFIRIASIYGADNFQKLSEHIPELNKFNAKTQEVDMARGNPPNTKVYVNYKQSDVDYYLQRTILEQYEIQKVLKQLVQDLDVISVNVTITLK